MGSRYRYLKKIIFEILKLMLIFVRQDILVFNSVSTETLDPKNFAKTTVNYQGRVSYIPFCTLKATCSVNMKVNQLRVQI